MHVRHLSLVDFRSWPTAEWPLQPGANVLIGRNGAGKTNLVEALGYLATLSSHRVASDAPLIQRGSERAIVRAAVVSDGRELLLEVGDHRRQGQSGPDQPGSGHQGARHPRRAAHGGVRAGRSRTGAG